MPPLTPHRLRQDGCRQHQGRAKLTSPVDGPWGGDGGEPMLCVFSLGSIDRRYWVANRTVVMNASAAMITDATLMTKWRAPRGLRCPQSGQTSALTANGLRHLRHLITTDAII